MGFAEMLKRFHKTINHLYLLNIYMTYAIAIHNILKFSIVDHQIISDGGIDLYMCGMPQTRFFSQWL